MDEANVGAVVTLRGRFWKADGDPGDPAAVQLLFTNPSGSTTTKDYPTPAELTRESTGVFAYGLALDDGGLWAYHFEGTGGDVTANTAEEFILVGSEASTGPCERWTTWDRVVACKASLSTVDDGVAQDLAIEVASELLWNLSQRRYPGLCTVTRSLCLECTSCGAAWYWWGSDGFNDYGRGCGCGPLQRIDLGGNGDPVYAVREVIVDGDVLDPSAYRLYDQRWLARVDGEKWPTVADLTDPNAFQATWVRGVPIPAAARNAAAKLAAEIAAQCSGQACELPSRVTSVVREGVSYTILDSLKMIDEGRTGVYMVDMWLAAEKKGIVDEPGMVNPAGHGGMVKTTF